ncbi:unnamed protein product [Arctia plantaginis]|uniref:CRAL-TRIO domain-containing protein n=1 Tax=Arctia plantaginis TaxID=874455 RepID=A0A8S1ALS3_ARCPL|nr:unnamed protein product [Arctia plantaginis]CAB3245650.1 unnamed protein product [Arctia plantaginis]
MEVIKPNPILKFHENHLQNVRKVLGYEDINRLRQDIEQFDEWIKKQSHFRIKEFDREYLERLLIYNKGSIERAKKKFDKLCTCTNLMPDFLKGFDVRNEFVPLFKVYDTCLLPTPTEDNYRVVLVQATGEEHDDFEVILFYRYLIVIGHYLLTHDYCQGFEIVADFRKLTAKTVRKGNPIVVHKALTLLTECMGQRMKKIHFFNNSKFFEAMLFLIKQGLSSKLKDRVVIHSSNEELYKHLPREMLAKEFGGDEKSVKELAEIQFKELSSDANIAKLKFMEEAATDESYRLPCTFNEEYSGVPGSFKTLCVD